MYTITPYILLMLKVPTSIIKAKTKREKRKGGRKEGKEGRGEGGREEGKKGNAQEWKMKK